MSLITSWVESANKTDGGFPPQQSALRCVFNGGPGARVLHRNW